MTGGSLTVIYEPSSDSTPHSDQFSSAVSIGAASLSIHTLQVDATRTFTVGDSALTVAAINLMPHASTPAKILLNGNPTLTSLGGVAATVANGSGAGATGRIDLGGAARTLTINDGAAADDLTIAVPIINGSLTKNGAGTLVLSGANTYIGDTRLTGGTLRLSGSATLANGADVYLQTAASLDLANASPDVVDSLFINGLSMPAGVWGAMGSGAQYTSPLITGAGKLQVTTFLPSADFDGNGFVNDADLAAWHGAFGSDVSGLAFDLRHSAGDANLDGFVNSSDFLIWQQQYGTSPSVAATVPEPASAAALLTALVALNCGGRLRRLSAQLVG
jgi:autotransporter-associated beta strand protein